MLNKQKIKTFLQSIPALKVAKYLVDDLQEGVRHTSRQTVTESMSGSTHATLSVAQSLNYIEEIFAEYKQYGGIEKFFGVAAEVGPGDNAGVALLMRGDGCTQVDLIDRYSSHRDLEHQSKIYDVLAQKYQLYNLRTQNDWNDQTLTGINWKIGEAAEVYFKNCAQEQGQVYDFIVSRAVLEHLYNPFEALRQMIDSLKSGGRMFHEIDFRDHNMFSPAQPELYFLQIPSSIYSRMVQNLGRPNRILWHRYYDVLEPMKNSGLIDYSILVTSLVDVGRLSPYLPFEEIELDKRCQAIDFVEKHRHKFAKEFRNVDSKYLAVSGIFLKVTKN